jgi:hypothetical protein
MVKSIVQTVIPANTSFLRSYIDLIVRYLLVWWDPNHHALDIERGPS